MEEEFLKWYELVTTNKVGEVTARTPYNFNFDDYKQAHNDATNAFSLDHNKMVEILVVTQNRLTGTREEKVKAVWL